MKPKSVYDWNQIPVVVDPPMAGLLLGMHADSITRLCRLGTIKAFRVGKAWRINRSELMRICGVQEQIS